MMRYLSTTAIASAVLLAVALPAIAQDGTATAAANIATYSGIPDFVASGEAFDAKACMDDKSIFTIPASSAIPFIKTITDHKAVIEGRWVSSMRSGKIRAIRPSGFRASNPP